jgi:hypothetical protein
MIKKIAERAAVFLGERSKRCASVEAFVFRESHRIPAGDAAEDGVSRRPGAARLTW